MLDALYGVRLRAKVMPHDHAQAEFVRAYGFRCGLDFMIRSGLNFGFKYKFMNRVKVQAIIRFKESWVGAWRRFFLYFRVHFAVVCGCKIFLGVDLQLIVLQPPGF